MTFNHTPKRRNRASNEAIRDIDRRVIELSTRKKCVAPTAPCDNKRGSRDSGLALISIKELVRWHLLHLRQDAFKLCENPRAGHPSQVIAKVHRGVILERAGA